MNKKQKRQHVIRVRRDQKERHQASASGPRGYPPPSVKPEQYQIPRPVGARLISVGMVLFTAAVGGLIAIALFYWLI